MTVCIWVWVDNTDTDILIKGNSEYSASRCLSYLLVCNSFPALLLLVAAVMPLLVIFMYTTITAVFRLGRSFPRRAVCAGAGVVVAVAMASSDIGMVVHGHLHRAAATQLAGGVVPGELSWCVIVIVVIRLECVESDCRHISAMIDGVLGHILRFQKGVHGSTVCLIEL